MRGETVSEATKKRTEYRVLLVDDNPSQLRLCRALLEDAGYLVDTASNATDALEAAKRAVPDVIMSDVLMDDIDGFGFCRRVRAEEALKSVPVILLSAHYQSADDLALSKRLGASDLVQRTPEFVAELGALRDCLVSRGRVSEPATAEYEGHLRTLANQMTKVLGQARSAEARYRTLFDHAVDAISLLTPDGIILEVNQRCTSLIGVPSEHMVGRHIRDFLPVAEATGLVEHYYATLAGGKGRTDQIPIQKFDGTTILMEFSLTKIELDGRPMVLAIGRDITEQKRLEESFRQAQKMEAIGQLTGGIAHDFNNILAAILANSHFLMEALVDTDQRYADAREIKLAAERAVALTRQLLAFSRRQVLAPAVVCLNSTVLGLEKMLRRMIGEDIALCSALASDLGSVRVDVGQIEQVIMNLAVNARDAMPSGGKLTIETRNLDIEESHSAPHGAIAPGRYVMIEVTDTGCGMSKETMQHIFEPFFTTKEVGKGTGLGLSTCYGIVKQSSGFIEASTELGRGTSFKVYLPRVDGAALAVTRSEAPPPHGVETILVIEDDSPMRTALRRVLEPYGYRVLVADDASQAVQIAKRDTESIRLILSDVVMPDVCGPELVDRICSEVGHDIRALFMSGYTDHAVLRSGALDVGVNFIQKPFAPEALAKKVRKVLDA